MADFKLTPHFSLNELLHTETGMINYPDQNTVWLNLQTVAAVLECIREAVQLTVKLTYSKPTHTKGSEKFGSFPEFKEVPVKVNSCYRSPSVNKAVGGSPASLHLCGLAFDIYVPGMSSVDLIALVEDLFDKNPIFEKILGVGLGYHYAISSSSAHFQLHHAPVA